MKLFQNATRGAALKIIKGRGHGTPVSPEVLKMLNLAITKAEFTSDTPFTYQVTGTCQSMNASDKYMMAVGVCNDSVRKIRVSVKSGRSVESTVTGYLWVPKKQSMANVYISLCAAVDTLNATKWSLLKQKNELALSSVYTKTKELAPSPVRARLPSPIAHKEGSVAPPGKVDVARIAKLSEENLRLAALHRQLTEKRELLSVQLQEVLKSLSKVDADLVRVWQKVNPEIIDKLLK